MTARRRPPWAASLSVALENNVKNVDIDIPRDGNHPAGFVSISHMIARTAAKAGKPKANHQRYSR